MNRTTEDNNLREWFATRSRRIDYAIAGALLVLAGLLVWLTHG